MSNLSKPTPGELEILRILWERGPSTVRDVHQVLAAGGAGYTTTLKLMQIMAEKGLVRRNETRRAHVYEPAAERAATEQVLVDELLERAFGGSARSLVMRALASKKAPPEEIAELRAMLDRLEKKP